MNIAWHLFCHHHRQRLYEPAETRALPIRFKPATPVVTARIIAMVLRYRPPTRPEPLHWSMSGATGPGSPYSGWYLHSNAVQQLHTSAPRRCVAALTLRQTPGWYRLPSPVVRTRPVPIQIVSPTTAGLTFSIDGIQSIEPDLQQPGFRNTYFVSVKTPRSVLRRPPGYAQCPAQHARRDSGSHRREQLRWHLYPIDNG